MKNQAKIIILGAGGHARVLLDELTRLGREVLGITDPSLEPGEKIMGVNVLGDDDSIFALSPDSVELVNGIGALPNTSLRWDIALKMRENGYQFSSVVSSCAIVSNNARLSEGVQVMAGSVIQTSVEMGRNSVANTGTRIDHDCVIGDNVWISPGVTICGNVSIGDGVYIGAGAVLIQDLSIESKSTINAGSVIKSPLPTRT